MCYRCVFITFISHSKWTYKYLLNKTNRYLKIPYFEVLQKQWRDGVMFFHLHTTVNHCKWSILLDAILFIRPVLATFDSTALHNSIDTSMPQWPCCIYGSILKLTKCTRQIAGSHSKHYDYISIQTSITKLLNYIMTLICVNFDKTRMQVSTRVLAISSSYHLTRYLVVFRTIKWTPI